VAASSTLSRRLSELLGVALFAAALIWLIALAVWKFGRIEQRWSQAGTS